MPFIIRASYEGNVRRWTQQSDVFPSYQSLSDQIHKIFKNVDNFYLTRVTFSTSAGVSDYNVLSTFVLIANTVHSAEEWTDTAAAPFLGVSYPSGMLKFVVNDNLQHKEAPVRSAPRPNSMDLDIEPRFPFTRMPTIMRGIPDPAPASVMQPFYPMPPSTVPHPVGPPPFVPFIPPPPPGPNVMAPPPPPSAPSLTRSDTSSSCCSVSTAKTEVRSMMEGFLKDFQKTMAENFGDDHVGDAMDTSSSAPERTPLAPNRPLSPIGNIPGAFNAPSLSEEPVVHPAVICDLCSKPLKGIRYKCNDCEDFDLCEACMGENNNGAVIHSVQLDKNHTFRAIPKPVAPASAPLPSHNASCDVCRKNIVGSRHKCLDCPDYDMCDKCIVSQRDKHDTGHEFYEFKEPGKIVIHNVSRPFPHHHHHRRGPFGHHHPSPSPFGHHHFGGPGSGRGRPRGGRGGLGGRPFGRPYSEDSSSGSERPRNGPNAPDVTVPPIGTPPQRVAHNATCDLCDNKIYGNRYKCGMCPDYDVCEGCFSIVAEQHPKHAFVRIRDPKDVMVRSHHYADRMIHHARCDSCGKQIIGARFKCIHRDCPDYDLCESCEALPIDTHPSSHALVKLKHPLSFYEGLAGVFEYAKTSSQKQKEMMDAANARLAPPEPLGTFLQGIIEDQDTPAPVVEKVLPVVVLEDEVKIPEVPLPVPEKVEQAMPSPLNPWWNDPVVDDATVLEGEGEREQMPLPTPVKASPVIVPVPEGRLAELTRALSIRTESIRASDLSSPSTVKSDLEEEEAEVAVVVAEEKMVVSAPLTEDSTSPFADAHAVKKTEDDAASVVSAAPSVISLASTTPSSTESVSRPMAAFITDLTIPDGHILPPGAFFVKSWQMLNNGQVPWPAGARLAFTGGERFGTTASNAEQLLVAGLTPPGEMTEVRVEFRAPEVPGKYTSYWRLQDEEGRLFGHRIWCDIEVVEPKREEVNGGNNNNTLNVQSSDASLSSSSIVIMPVSVPSEAANSTMASPVQEPLPTPTLSSSFDYDEIRSHMSGPDTDDVYSVVSESEWEEASRPQSPDQFVMVYESSNDASDSD